MNKTLIRLMSKSRALDLDGILTAYTKAVEALLEESLLVTTVTVKLNARVSVIVFEASEEATQYIKDVFTSSEFTEDGSTPLCVFEENLI